VLPVPEGLACLLRSLLIARVTSDRGRHYTLIQYPQQMHRSARHVRPRNHGPAGAIFGFLGEILLTAGVLILLYVAYVLWGTGIQTERAQSELREQTITQWDAGIAADDEADDDDAEQVVFNPDELDLGDAYALLRIPRFGDDWEWVVVQGT
jgi:hypothetical protein